jgi:hypothetical protein
VYCPTLQYGDYTISVGAVNGVGEGNISLIDVNIINTQSCEIISINAMYN